SDGSFSYTTDLNFSGTDSFTYEASDGMANSGLTTVTIIVKPSNAAPAGNTDTYTVGEDSLLTVAAPGVLSNDTDADNDSLTARLLSAPSNGVVAFQADGSFTYQPNTNFSGVDSFAYVANDGLADSTATLV